MRTVFILINNLRSGGAEKQSIYLYRNMKIIYSTKLVVYYGDQKDSRMLDLLGDDLNDVIWLEGSHLSKLMYFFRMFSNAKADVCISYLATTNFINAIIGKLAGVKIRIGGIRNSRFKRRKLLIQRFLHNHWLSYSVFNNNNGLQALVNKGFNVNKSSVIFNCIDAVDYCKEFDKPEIVNILTVGRFVEQKDYYTALDVIRLLDARKLKFRYTIIGHGVLEQEISNYVSYHNLNHIVEVFIKPKDISNYYKNADIYLSTSLFEGLSNSIMEALSYCLPVVATDVGDNNHLVRDGESGYLTQVRDIEDIADKLELLIRDAELRKAFGEAGKRHVSDNFSVSKFVEKYVELIESLAKK